MDLKSLASSLFRSESYSDQKIKVNLSPEPGVLVFSDIDDTFIPWKLYNQVADVDKLQHTKATLNLYQGQTINGLCSARGLGQIQDLAPFLRDFPLSFIGTNGGQQVYINDKNLPAEQWLTSLKVHDSDREWDREVSNRSGGFNTQLVTRATHQVLKEFGFQPCAIPLPPPHQDREAFVAPVPGGKEGQVAVVALTRDQTTLMFRADFKNIDTPLTPAHKALSRKLARRLEERLTRQGVSLTAKQFVDQSNQQIYLLEPKNISKESLVSYLLRRYPSVYSIITAGDNTNDTMLLPDNYLGVTNRRIVSGDRPDIMQAMDGRENVEKVTWGDLSPGLNYHLQQIFEPEPPAKD